MDNRRKKKIAPVVVAILVILYMGPLMVMLAMAAGFIGAHEAGGIMPFFLLYAFSGGAVIVGVLRAMFQRLREIDGGEEDEAKKY